MNKILSILAVVALVVAMAVPVFAEASDTFNIKDAWLVYYNVTDGVTVDGTALEYNKVYRIQHEYHGDYYLYGRKVDGTKFTLPETSASSPQVWNYTDLEANFKGCVSSGTVSSTNGIQTYYFMVEKKCDGSTCPATDVNQDNVCDDCGMTFAVLRDYGLPDPYTVWDAEQQQLYPYAFVYEDASGNDFLILSALEPYYENGSVVVYENAGATSYLKYTIWGTTWKYDGGFNTAKQFETSSVTPSFNLLNTDGSVAFSYDSDFFPKPLWAVMGQVTQGEMMGLTQETAGTMKVLVLCGVGLMALLVVLKLFGKRSLISLR